MERFRVVIAGGGVAGLEGLLALREHAGGGVDITLLAPDEEFHHRPLSVYARAEQVRLHGAAGDGQIEIAVRDDGVGFDPQAPHQGFGILGMRERIAMAGGTLEITSAPGAGVEIRAAIPIGREPLASRSTASA